MDEQKFKNLNTAGSNLGLEKYQKHIFLCCDQSKPKCCTKQEGLESWLFLKNKIREINNSERETLIYRSKVNCLQVCIQGPIAVVYPDGIWYHSCSPQNLDKIISEHLLGDRVVKELQFAENKNFQILEK